MEKIFFLLLSVVVTWAGTMIAIKPRRYKEEVGNHPIGGSPIWVLRVLGVCMASGGLWIFYHFLISQRPTGD
jgi:hypothetical protein